MSQLPLFGTGRTSRECRADAARHERPKRPSRKSEIRRLLAESGYAGLTRFQLAKLMGTESGAICAAVLDLLENEEIFELTEKRNNPTGSAGAVLVSRDWLDGRPLS